MSVQSSSLKAVSIARPATLDSVLKAARRRIRAMWFLRVGAWALLVTAGAGLLAVGASRLRLLPTPEPWAIALLIGLGLLCAALVALLRPLTDLDAARLVERRADLKERLSSAVQFRQAADAAELPFYDAQRADADRHAAALDLKTLLPVRAPRLILVSLAATLALFLVYFLPTLPAFQSPQQKKEAEAVKRQGAAIEKVAKDLEKSAAKQNLGESKKAAQELKKLGEAMRKNRVSKKQALVAMQKLTRKMQEAQKQLAANQPAKSLEQAREQFKKSLDQMQKEVAAAQQKRSAQAGQNRQSKTGAKQAGKKPGESQSQKEAKAQKPPSEAMKQAMQALEQMQQAMQDQNLSGMQQAMEQMARQMQSGQLSPEEMRRMQQALEKLAQALAGTSQDQAAKQLQQLAQQMRQALQNGQKLDPKTLEQLAQLMKQLGQQMGKAQGRPMDAKDLQALKELLEAMKANKMALGTGNRPGNWMPVPLPGESGRTPGGKGAGNTTFQLDKSLEKKGKRTGKLPDTKVAGQRNRPSPDWQQSMTGDPDATKSSSPYFKVYESRRQAAENALNKENIPAAYKKQVRDYFDSIKP